MIKDNEVDNDNSVKEFYTVTEFAKLAGLTRQRIGQLLREEQSGLTGQRLANRQWVIKKRVGDRWLEDRKQE